MINLDGTPTKSKLGANAILGVSMAVCRAAAFEQGIPLYKHLQQISKSKKLVIPTPAMNIINGGKHAGNNLDIQEFMILPTGTKSFSEGLRVCAETYHHLKKVILEKHGKNAINVGDEGGFAPPIKNIEEALNLIEDALSEAGHADTIQIGLDCAASEFYTNFNYSFEGKSITREKLTFIYEQMAQKYGIITIEDPFHEEDFDGFSNLTEKIGNKVQIVGDDLLVTNVDRIKTAIAHKSCNALLLKVNQIGSVTEAINAANLGLSVATDDMGIRVIFPQLTTETRQTLVKVLKAKIWLCKALKPIFALFSFCLKKFLYRYEISNEVCLGFTFSFPIDQTAIDEGRLLNWTKGFGLKGVIGKDVVQLLKEALAKRGLGNVEILALLNDTVGTLVARSYKDPDCRIGIILGTGTNACYSEKLLNISCLPCQ